MTVTEPIPRGAKVRARMPLLLAWTTRYVVDGQVVDIEHVLMTSGRWRRWGRERRAEWGARPVGPLVIVERMVP